MNEIPLPALRPLGPKEDMFVREYLRDMSAPMAAVRAGYSKTAGARLVKNPAIRDAIDAAVAARSVRVGINTDRVLDELGNLGFANLTELFNDDGTMKNVSEMTPDQAKLIAGMKARRVLETGPDGTKIPVEIIEYKFVDKLMALSMMMRHLSLFKDTVTVEVSTLADRLQAAMRRVPALPSPGAALDGEFVELPVAPELEPEPLPVDPEWAHLL